MSKSFDVVVSPVQTIPSLHTFREEHCKLCYYIMYGGTLFVWTTLDPQEVYRLKRCVAGTVDSVLIKELTYFRCP